MKLHLPKMLLIAVMTACSYVQAAMTTPTQGINKYTYVNGGWVKDANNTNTSTTPSRDSAPDPDRGAFMVISEDFDANNTSYGDTSDGDGGVWVEDNVTVTNFKLGSWAGSVYVGSGANLTASLQSHSSGGYSIKSGAAENHSNIWVDGSFTLSGLRYFDDGGNNHYWHIGTNGKITLSDTTNITKNSKTWNIEVVENNFRAATEEELAATLTNRSTTQTTHDFLEAGADLSSLIDSVTIILGDGTECTAASLSGTDGHHTATVNNAIELTTLTWAGTADNDTWTNTGSNWVDSNGAATSFLNGDSVTFGAAAEGISSTVNVGSSVTVNNMAVNGSYTLNIADSASLAVQGELNITGALTLTANANTTLGSVIIEAGAGLEINTAENITVSMGGFSYHDTSTLTKSGAGTLNMGALSNGKTNVASFNGGITVNAGILQFTGTSDENWPDDVEPAFVQLLRNVTTTGTGKVQVVGDVNCSNQLQTEASIAIDDNIEVTGNLRINSVGTTTGTAEADGQKYRLWNIATGGTLTVGEQLWLTNKQKLTVNGGSLEAGSIKLGHEENGADGPYPSRIVVESGSLKTGSITFWGSGNSVTMTGGSLEFTGSQAISAENGCSNGTFSISGGTLKATETAWTLTGGNGVTVTVGGVTIDGANTHGITLNSVTLNGAITNNKTLTLENVTVAGNVSLTNSGTLTVNGAYSSNSKIANTNADAVINFNGDVTFSAGSGGAINGVNPGYVITGSGTTNFTGGEIISGTAESPQILSLQNGATVVVGGGTNTTTMTLGQLRLHDGSFYSAETFTVKGNAVVTITGEDSSGTGGSAVVLGHWHNGTSASVLLVEGGQLNVLNGSIRIGYDSAASFSITEGSANVAKITFRQNEDADSLTLNGGRLNVGKGGIIVESDAVNESYKANTKVDLTGGTLGALYSEGAENQGWTLDGRLTTTIGTLDVDTTAVNADGSSSGTGATITIEKASTASSGSAITLTGSGALVIKEFVADTGVSTFGQQEGSSATMTVNSLSVNTGASLTANNALTIGGTIKNDGSLTLNGTIYLSGDIDTSFAHREQGSSSYVDVNGEASTGNNGFLKLTSASYWLTQSSDGVTGATITLGEDFATLDGKKVVYQGDSAFQLDTDTNGQLYFSPGSITSTQYYISSGDVEITSGVLSKATGYTLQGGNMQITTGVVNTSAITYTEGTIELSDGAQLKVDALLGNKTAADLLTGIVTATPATEGATPTGKLVIATNGLATGNANLTTTFEGTLELAENISFTFGAASDGNSADGKTINTSSLTGLVLNAGSTLKYTGSGLNTQFANTTVNGTGSAATFYIIDGNKANAIQFTGKTMLNNNLNLTSVWDGKINIAHLAGEGTLTASGSNSDEMFYTSIESLNGFTGSLIFADTNSHVVEISTGTGSDLLSFTRLQFASGTGVTNSFNVQKDTTVGTISVSGDGTTINIEESGTLHAFTKEGSGTITLTGSGTYDLGSNTSTNVSGLTDASWSGIVKISNATIDTGNGILLNNYGNAASTIQLENVVSFQPNDLTNDTCDSDIKLVGEGWKITDGWSSNYSADDESVGIKFTGDFSGGGKLQFVQRNSNSVDHRYIFTGDLSAWTGAIEHTSGGANMNVYLVFKDNVSEINTSITGGVGTLNLTADADVHFTKDVDVTKMIVNAGKTATLTGDANSLKAGDATITSKAETDAALSNVTVQAGSISATNTTDGTKGSISSAKVEIAQLQEDASFTIQDMTLTNTTVTAATVDTKVNLQNVTASNMVLAKGKFSTDAPMSVVGAGGTAFSASTSAITKDSSITINASVGASLAVDLGDLSCVTAMGPGKYDLSITLSGVRFDSYENLTAGSGIIFTADSWLGQLLTAQGATAYVSGAVETPASVSEGGSTGGVSVSYSAATGENVGTVITITGLNVPEPATSTLSLLALAALAARRRRK